jgi:hypothetical protein
MAETICTNCTHHWNMRPSCVDAVWYQHKCRHPSSRSEVRDFVTGSTTIEWAYCRDRNRGNCADYEDK